MSTQNPKFQVGDVIYGGTYNSTRTVLEVDIPGRGYRFAPQRGNEISGWISQSCVERIDGNAPNYALVERPGDTKQEEVKNMSKFQAGDVIQFGSSIKRLVFGVQYDEYRLSDNLVNSSYLGTPFNDSVEYVDGNYVLAARPDVAVDVFAHKADMAKLSEMLAAEARQRGWCSEYATVIDRFNEQLTIPLVAHPKTNVTTAVTLIITMRRTDELDNAAGNPADHAYNTYWDDAVKAVTPPPGWELASVQRDGHTYNTTG